MSRRLRQEDGFTLPELLVTISIAMIVSLATFALLDFSIKRAGEVDQRVDATQRGRALMDTITRQLRSQVCLDATTAAMATRPTDITDGYTATFYADFTDGTDVTKPPAQLHKLAYDQTTKRMLDYTYATSWDKTKTPWLATVAGAPVPGSPRVVATDIEPDGANPIFRYYAYDAAAVPAPVTVLNPGNGATISVPLADLKRVARIDIRFKTLPQKGATGSPAAVVMQDQVYVRAADPNDDAPTPVCA
jgi:prepilin-type N-terminal cleavage/methylation domain-containing protein